MVDCQNETKRRESSMRFTKEEVRAVQDWRQEVTGKIRFEISERLSGEQTTLEEDEAMASGIFEVLLDEEYLAMPEGKTPTADGGHALPSLADGAVER